MKQTHKVVMLPTEKASKIFIKDGILKDSFGYRNICVKSDGYLPQHIHILSDDEIKEGDWYIAFNVDGEEMELRNSIKHLVKGLDRKVIATTDKSLSILIAGGTDGNAGMWEIYPKLQESFIKAYIKAYNEGNPITEVEVEYETLYKNKKGLQPFPDEKCEEHIQQLKLNSDNTIIIHSKEEKMYSREDLYMSASFVVDQIAANRGNSDWNMKTTPKMIVDKWIKENL